MVDNLDLTLEEKFDLMVLAACREMQLDTEIMIAHSPDYKKVFVVLISDSGGEVTDIGFVAVDGEEVARALGQWQTSRPFQAVCTTQEPPGELWLLPAVDRNHLKEFMDGLVKTLTELSLKRTAQEVLDHGPYWQIGTAG